jgi:hypothetical protein
MWKTRLEKNMGREVSRRRYAALLKMLRQAVVNEKLPWAQRLRAGEMILLVHGDWLPEFAGSDKRNRKTIRELIEERSFEKGLKQALAGTPSPAGSEEAQDAQGEQGGGATTTPQALSETPEEFLARIARQRSARGVEDAVEQGGEGGETC